MLVKNATVSVIQDGVRHEIEIKDAATLQRGQIIISLTEGKVSGYSASPLVPWLGKVR